MVDTETSQATTTKTRYLHKDHLGSVVAITDESGGEVSRFRYDPFGKQYTVVNQSPTAQTPVVKWLEDTQRGFTGHEMLNSVDVIHMNGRIYDANIGRFMQADAYIQAPKNMQSMNRYSYVLNNPLSYTDPSGHFFKALKRNWRSIAAIAINVYFCGGGCSFLQAVAAGAASGAVATGSLKGALTGALSAAAFYGIGQAFEGVSNANFNAGVKSFEKIGLSSELSAFAAEITNAGALTSIQQVGKVLAHAAAGGVMSKLNGGKFGNGFLSAGVTQAFSKAIGGLDSGNEGFSGQRAVAASVLGGVTSEVTGGKFANGAVTGAFSRAFNDELHVGGKVSSFLLKGIEYVTGEPILANGFAGSLVVTFPTVGFSFVDGLSLDGEFDLGVTGEADVRGISFPTKFAGKFKLPSRNSLLQVYGAIGGSGRTIQEMAGTTLTLQGQFGVFGGSVDANVDDFNVRTTSAELQIGIGYDLGINPTVTTSCSLRNWKCY